MADPIRSTTPITTPLVNPDSFGTTSTGDPLSVDPRRAPTVKQSVSDPGTGSFASSTVSPAFVQLITSQSAAPRAAEAAAQWLLDQYGPFNAQNSAANRNAIISHLVWLASERGVNYDYQRGGTDTRSPNETISTRSGVCRDTHTAIAAIIGALATSRVSGTGWILGTPAGTEQFAQAVGFANPDEYHAITLFRDPATGTWGALEYSKAYTLGAQDALSAISTLTGSTTSVDRYALRGWNGGPYMVANQSTGSQDALDFFTLNPGMGKPGEVRLNGGFNAIDASVHLTPGLSLNGRFNLAQQAGGFTGGAMVHYNGQSTGKNFTTRYHLGLGGYLDRQNASVYTGYRDAEYRANYDTFLIGVRADVATQSREFTLIDKHLRLSGGGGVDLLASIPLDDAQNDNLGRTVIMPRILDYSQGVTDLNLRFSGTERLGSNVQLDWNVWGRMRFDVVQFFTELVTSAVSDGGAEVRNSLVSSPWFVGGNLSLSATHMGPLEVRIEAGAQGRAGTPFDPSTSVNERHYLGMRLRHAHGDYSFSALAVGGYQFEQLRPFDMISLSGDIRLSQKVSLGIGANLTPFDWSQSSANASVRFAF